MFRLRSARIIATARLVYDALSATTDAVMPEPTTTTLEQQAGTGDAGASYRLAERLYKQVDARVHAGRIGCLLQDAVIAGVVPALRTVGYLAQQSGSNDDLARLCCFRAAQAEDAAAAFFLAELGGDADLDGTDESILERVSSLPLFPEPKNTATDIISEDPPIRVYHEVLDSVDCRYVMALALPTLGGGRYAPYAASTFANRSRIFCRTSVFSTGACNHGANAASFSSSVASEARALRIELAVYYHPIAE